MIVSSCPTCGVQVRADADRCWKCGASFIAEEPPPAQPAPAQGTPSRPVQARRARNRPSSGAVRQETPEIPVRCGRCGAIGQATARHCHNCGARFGTQQAGFWIRTGAYLLDILILIIPYAILSYIASAIAGPAASSQTDAFGNVSNVSLNGGYWWLFNLLAFVLDYLYFGFFWTGSGQTPGMKAVGIRLRRYQSDDVISWGTAFGRLFMLGISFSVLCLGVIWVAFQSEHRGWHDLAAGTEVVYAR